MGPIGVQEMMLIFLVALVLFGPKKLPELGRLLGKGLTEYRRAKSELKSTFETHLRELEREANVDTALKNTVSPYSSPTSIASTSTYDEYGQYEPSYSSPAPYPETASSEPASLPSSTASATATQDAEAYRETPSIAAPVAGTVPRANGIQPEDAHAAAGPEGHSA